MHYHKGSLFSPSRIILMTMAFAIVTGSFLLSLACAQKEPISFIDTLFTATSATCVTGLLTVPLTKFSSFGHFIIMILMQIGGLGLITLTLCVVSVFTRFGLATQVLAGELLDLDSWTNTRRILLFIFIITLCFEALGVLCVFSTFRQHFPFWQALFYATFHSISSFCNAGISLFHTDLCSYSQSPLFLICTGILMTAGGIGFITWYEIYHRAIKFNHAPIKRRLSLQSRIILYYFGIFFIGNSIFFWLLERQNTLAHLSEPYKILNALFTATSIRSCGHLTVIPQEMNPATQFFFMLNSFIGSAPGSAGSGIKITTLAIVVATVGAIIQNNTDVVTRGRKIITEQIYRALSIIALSLLWIIITTFCLLLTEPNAPFLMVFFEAFSAFATFGVSLGFTPYLSVYGKTLVIITMFVGRIGYLTLMIALRQKIGKTHPTYPEERIMIG